MTYSAEPKQPTAHQQVGKPTQVAAQCSSEPRLIDNRASTAANVQLQAMMDASPRHDSAHALQQLVARRVTSHAAPVQRVKEDDPLQAKLSESTTVQLAAQEAPKPNNTG